MATIVQRKFGVIGAMLKEDTVPNANGAAQGQVRENKKYQKNRKNIYIKVKLTEIVQTNQLKIKKRCTMKALTVCERVLEHLPWCQMHGRCWSEREQQQRQQQSLTHTSSAKRATVTYIL